MELQLKNIGMIKEANVKIDGLTVIAGENDTGKSTLGKVLFKESKNYLLSQGSDILIDINKNINPPILIETPEFLSEFKLFNRIIKLEEELLNDDIEASIEELRLPSTKMSLLINLASTNQIQPSEIYKNIEEVIKGRVYYDDTNKDILFIKKGLKEPLLMDSTSSGIKMFGFIQILLLNKSIQNGTILILDEPEVHLHPKWQLKMAEIIVELVKNGVYIVVNSHSPYMIEALQRYSEVENIEDKTNFYLAENGLIDKVEESNALTLEKIFGKLSEPFDIFDEMDSRILRGE